MDYRLDYVRFKLWHWQCLRCISFRHLNANSNPYTQWGFASNPNSVTFPLAFPNNLYCVNTTVVAWNYNQANAGNQSVIYYFSKTGITSQTWSGNERRLFWISLGN